VSTPPPNGGSSEMHDWGGVHKILLAGVHGPRKKGVEKSLYAWHFLLFRGDNLIQLPIGLHSYHCFDSAIPHLYK